MGNISIISTVEKCKISKLRLVESEARTYSIKEIQTTICKIVNLGHNEISADRREYRSLLPRQVAIVLCILLTRHSLAEIGRRFGGRDHSTICNTKEKMIGLMDELRPVLDDAPLDYLARIALKFAYEHYSPHKQNRRSVAMHAKL